MEGIEHSAVWMRHLKLALTVDLASSLLLSNGSSLSIESIENSGLTRLQNQTLSSDMCKENRMTAPPALPTLHHRPSPIPPLPPPLESHSKFVRHTRLKPINEFRNTEDESSKGELNADAASSVVSSLAKETTERSPNTGGEVSEDDAKFPGRLKRSGWWNAACNREEEIQRVKGLMRHSALMEEVSDIQGSINRMHDATSPKQATRNIKSEIHSDFLLAKNSDGNDTPSQTLSKTARKQAHLQESHQHSSAVTDDLRNDCISPAAEPAEESHLPEKIKKPALTFVPLGPAVKMKQAACNQDRSLVAQIINEDKRPFGFSCLTSLKTVLKYCLDNNLTETMECLEREAPKVLSMQRESETAPFEWRLISCLNKGDFESAQKWFHDSVLLDLRDELKQGFLEIKYRLYKLEVLSCAKSQSLKEASELIKEKLLPLVKAWKKEFPDCGGKLRSDVTAFENQLRSSTILPDYSISIEFLLSDELGPDLYMTSSDARGVFSAICSLYDHDYKLIDEEISLEYALDSVQYRRNIKKLLGITESSAANESIASHQRASPMKIDHKPRQEHENKDVRVYEKDEKSLAHPIPDDASGNQHRESVDTIANVKASETRSPDRIVHSDLKEIGAGSVDRAVQSLVTEKPKRRTAVSRGNPEKTDTDKFSTGSSAFASGMTDALEKLMPPASSENESADFALSTECGPAVGHIRALATQDVGPSRIVVATSGGEDRSDRKISLWDARSGTMEVQLDNGTPKPVTCLAFHPAKKNLLLSADMDFDVKLWDWQTGNLLRCWKKHHKRVVWRISFVSRREDLAASCSGDQSLKIWNIDADNEVVASAHANEPFTSFLFCGDPSSQTVIASLSYSLRIYKLRTMSLLHTIQLKDLKESKTPVSSIASHPDYENFILISCDNQIRLFDLNSETQLRIYTARELGPGTRIEGNFSPCGTFIYCGSWDIRAYGSSSPSVNRRASLPNVRGGVFSPAGEHGEEKPKERGSSEALGVYIWRVATGRLERSEMRAMEDSNSRAPVTICRWVRWGGDNGKKGVKKRKALIAATINRCIKTYL